MKPINIKAKRIEKHLFENFIIVAPLIVFSVKVQLYENVGYRKIFNNI